MNDAREATVDSLPISLQAGHRERLINIKEIYDSALYQSRLDSLGGRVLAIIAFDLAVEAMLRLACEALAPKAEVPREFSKLLGKTRELIRSVGGMGVVGHAALLRQHESRNAAQHLGERPSTEQVEQSREASSICMHQLTESLWGQDFDCIDLLDALTNERVKEHLSRARDEIVASDPDPEKVIVHCWRSMRIVEALVRDNVVGPRFEPSLEANASRPIEERASRKAFFEAFARVQDSLVAVVLGMDARKYWQFSELVGSMQEIPPRGVMRWGGKQQLTLDDANFVYSYCLEAALEAERRGQVAATRAAQRDRRLVSRVIQV
jgi:hypothetical protein